MDEIPVSLAIAQAAKETGWGTSRFALEGNALFGQWTWSGDGIKPAGADEADEPKADESEAKRVRKDGGASSVEKPVKQRDGDEADEADTDKDTDSPAPTEPIEPALVEKVGSAEAVIIAFELLAARPVSNSTLTSCSMIF